MKSKTWLFCLIVTAVGGTARSETARLGAYVIDEVTGIPVAGGGR